jgi:NAD kinase
LEVVEKVRKLVEGKRYDIVKLDGLNYECFSNRDLVISIGGDATVLRPAGYLIDTPIIGINAQIQTSRGFLTSLNANNVNILEEILEGNYQTIQRQRAEVNRNGKSVDELVLNEIYFGTKQLGSSMRYSISFRGKQEEQRSSGLIVVTGTGSTGRYSSMAQDPLSFVKRDVSFPYDSRILKFMVDDLNRDYGDPSIIFGIIKEGEDIRLESRMNSNGYIASDGNRVYDFNQGDVFRVRLSDRPLNVIVKK